MTDITEDRPILYVAEADANTGETITRPYTAEEAAQYWRERELEAANPPISATHDPLEELRAQINELQALVASLTKGVQTAP
jgi:hypothetical protein